MFENPTPAPHPELLNPPPCPKCNSHNVEFLYRARRIGGTVGTLAGAAGGIASAVTGARTGMAVGMAAGPAGAAVGGIVGLIFAGLMGGGIGGIACAAVGDVIDENILDNCHCLHCDHTFSLPQG